MITNFLTANIKRILKVKDVHLETPEVAEHGDYSTNVALQTFSQTLNSKSKTLNKSPVTNHQSPKQYAEYLVKKLKADDSLASMVEKIEVAGPGFINFWTKKEVLAKEISKVDENYGKSDLLKGKKYLIEHTSPNPNKAMHLGHLRNNVTGMAIANIWEFVGADVIRDDIDNNRGIAIAKLMWGYLRYAHKSGDLTKKTGLDQKKMVKYWSGNQGEWTTPDKNTKPDRFVDGLYVKGATDFKKQRVEKEIRQLVVDWEAEDIPNRKLWKKVLVYSYKGQEITLKRLGNKWDKIWHEHEHYQKGKDVVKEALKKGIFRKGEGGAIVTNLSKYNIPDTVVIKSDGTALYITQDLALTRLKKETFNPDKLFWTIGPEQSLALKQMFSACEQLGIVKVKDCVHLSYGWMSLKGASKMSSRSGNVIYIDDLLDSAKEEVRKIMNKDDFSSKDAEQISEDVGVGAVKYSILKVSRSTDTAFDFKESIDISGNSGPYLQYTFARTQSVLAKAKEMHVHDIDITDDELELARTIPHFPEVVATAAETYSPNLVAGYLYDLAKKFNSFYNAHKIVGGENEATKLVITSAVGQILKNGLKLLGIKAPERM